jgi:hypothetical protein
MKIKSFGNGKVVKLLKDYNGITFDNTHVLTRQSLVALKANDGYKFKSIDRYVKLYESVEELASKVDPED